MRNIFVSARSRMQYPRRHMRERAIARARVGYPRQPARRPARAELTPPPSPSHRTRLSRRRDAHENHRTCLCPPPFSATWHCAHLVLKILAPVVAITMTHRDACVVSRSPTRRTHPAHPVRGALGRAMVVVVVSRAYLSRRPRRGLRQTNSSSALAVV